MASAAVPFVLFVGSGLALWLAALVQRRRAPGRRTFTWLLVAIATWCGTGAAHWLADPLQAKLVWARLQYLGIASVPPLWFTFACEYAGSTWPRRRRNLVLLWTIPILTLGAAFTNEWHRALWPDVTLTAGGAAVYAHGWWFWVAAAYSYVLLLLSTGWLVSALRRSPPPYRAQYVALVAAAVLPWTGNLVYLSGLSAEGIDPTPLLFALSGILFTSALYRNHLFDLVPVARDQLVDSLSDAVIVIDRSRRVVDVNAAGRRLVESAAGTAAAQWVGMPVDRLLPFLGETSLTLVPGPAPNFLVTVGDAPRHYDVRVTPVSSPASELVAWAVLLRDVTDQRRAAAEREALERRVQEQQKRESLSVLAGGLAHDFNNLLAGIIGNADLLALEMPRSSRMGGHVGAIILGAQRAADLVSKMLAYAGERHGASEVVDLDALIREMLGLLEASVARHCKVRYEGKPALIFADPVQIRQVAMNLIINAAEAVEETTGAVSISVGAEQLSGWQLADMHSGADMAPGAYAYLEVRDNGPGIDQTTLRHIFTPFYTTKSVGHGLGLAAVQGIVRGHRGALRVTSRVGAGSTFRVWFPRAQQGRGARGKGQGLSRASVSESVG